MGQTATIDTDYLQQLADAVTKHNTQAQALADNPGGPWDRFLDGLARSPGIGGVIAGGINTPMAAGQRQLAASLQQIAGLKELQGAQSQQIQNQGGATGLRSGNLGAARNALDVGRALNAANPGSQAQMADILTGMENTGKAPTDPQGNLLNVPYTPPVHFMDVRPGGTAMAFNSLTGQALNQVGTPQYKDVGPGAAVVELPSGKTVAERDFKPAPPMTLFPDAGTAQKAIDDGGYTDTHTFSQETGGYRIIPKNSTAGQFASALGEILNRNGMGGTAAPKPPPVGPGKPAALAAKPAAGKPLDAATAKAILQQAGGNKDKARALATQAGYTF